MAIRFDNSADRLYRNSDLLDYNAAYTVAYWFKISVDTNDFAVVYVHDAGGGDNTSNYDYTGFGSNGTAVRVSSYTGGQGEFSGNGSDVAAGTWYHCALVRTGVNGNLIVYIDGTEYLNIASNMTGRSTTGQRMEFGAFGPNSYAPFNGCIAYARAWQAALSQGEIEDEINSTSAVRTSNLYADWPLEVHTDVDDISGNGRHWTVSGTLTTEGNPPLDGIVIEETIKESIDTGTSLVSPSWAPQANELLLVFVGSRRTADAPSSVSGNGMTWTNILDVTGGTTVQRINVYRAMSGSTPSSGAITVSWVTNTQAAWIIAVRLSGVDTSGTNGSGAIEDTESNTTGTQNNDCQVDITTLTNGAIAMAFSAIRRQTITLPSGDIAIDLNNSEGATTANVTCSLWYEPTPTAGTVTLGGNNIMSDNDDWTVVALAIKPAGSTPTTISDDFTASAAIQRTISGTFAAASAIQRTIAGTFTSASAIQRTIAGSLTAEAVIGRTIAETFTGQAAIQRAISATFGADSAILRTPSATFTADSSIYATVGETFTAAAVVGRTISATFTAAAALLRTLSTTFSADAEIIEQGSVSGTFTAQAVVQRTLAGTFTSAAAIQRTPSATFDADSAILRTVGATFDSAAAIGRTIAGSFVGASAIQRTLAATFSADASVVIRTEANFAAAAVIRRTVAGTFSAAATILGDAPPVYTVTADVELRLHPQADTELKLSVSSDVEL